MAAKNTKLIENLRQRTYNKQCMDCQEKVLLNNELGYYLRCHELWNICLLQVCRTS